MKVFVVGPSWVGDMVMAQSLFKELRRLYPDAVIDVLAPAWSRPILEAMPEVRRPIDMPVGHGKLMFKARKVLAKQLVPEKYDWAIVLPNSLKSALIPWLAKIPRRTGWRGEMRYGLLNDIRKLDKQALPLMVERFVALAQPKGQPHLDNIVYPSLELKAEEVAEVKSRFGIDTTLPILGLCPGAEFGAAKQWSAEHYAVVAQDHLNRGGQVWLFGSENDQVVCREIIFGLSAAKTNVCDFSGQTSLQEAVVLISLVSQVVSNDSGLMHVAAALGRPLVAVYGSTSPDFTPPLSRQVQLVQLGIDCSPCFERTCPYGHYKCLRDLKPDRVIQALASLESAIPAQEV